MEAFPFSSNYLERELHTRHADSPVMLWAHTRAKGSVLSRKIYFKKKGGIWRILSVPKYVIINLKINNFNYSKFTIIKKYSAYLSQISIQMSMLVRK